MTLHFYSPKAYRYVRKYFRNHLPSISTIRNSYCSIDSSPGFNKAALEILKQKAKIANTNGTEILACLSFDEVHIRRHLQWDNVGKTTTGFISYGTNSNSECGDEIPIVSQALVFMLTGVNEKFKLPIGYFFINTLTSVEKAALVQEILLLLNRYTGIKTIALTFDGLPANKKMCQDIDAGFCADNPYIVNPHSCDEVLVFLDPSHMLKLVRNTLGRYKTLYDKNGESISWQFIEKLYKYQHENSLNLGNKITKRHILWDKHIMSVRIACETLSDSVADSLEILLNQKVSGFENCQATIRFIRQFNNLFDIMNSKKDDATGSDL